MTIDYNKYDYVRIGNYTNVVAERRKEETPEVRAGIVPVPFLHEFVRRIAFAHGEWLLVAAHSYSTEVNVFRVYQDGEYLGTFRREAYGRFGEHKFSMESPSIRNKMQRSSRMATNNIDKAIKIVNEHFVPATGSAQINSAKSDISTRLSSMVWSTQRMVTTRVEKFRPSIMQYLRFHADDAGRYVPGLDQMLKEHDEHTNAMRLQQMYQNDRGVILVVNKGGYFMHVPDEPEPRVVTNADLSDAVATNLAMLKLCNDEQAVDGVGYRLDANTFFVLDTVQS